MTRFEFTDEPYGVYFIGGIMGCWPGFKRFIGCVFGGRKQSDYMTLFEKKMFDRIYKENRNLQLPRLAMEVVNDLNEEPSCTNKLTYTNKLIISTGSAQLGRYEPEYYDKVFRDLNGFLEEQRIKLLLVRGGDDDPSYYDGRVDYSNIKAIPDYSMVTVNTTYSKCGSIEFCDDQRKILCIGGGRSERQTGYEMLHWLAKRSGKSLGGNVVFSGSGFYLLPKEIHEAEEEHVDTLVTFSDEINDLKNYRESGVCGILRNLLVWYRSGDQKKSLISLSYMQEKTPLVSRPQYRRLDDYTSIHRLRGVAKNHMIDVDGSTAFLSSRLSEEIRRELLRLATIRADVGFDVPQM
jgi:hypothetical protein